MGCIGGWICNPTTIHQWRRPLSNGTLLVNGGIGRWTGTALPVRPLWDIHLRERYWHLHCLTFISSCYISLFRSFKMDITSPLMRLTRISVTRWDNLSEVEMESLVNLVAWMKSHSIYNTSWYFQVIIWSPFLWTLLAADVAAFLTTRVAFHSISLKPNRHYYFCKKSKYIEEILGCWYQMSQRF